MDIRTTSRFKKTLAHSFLLPLLEPAIPIYNRDYEKRRVINCFLYDEELPQFRYSYAGDRLMSPHLFLLVRNQKSFSDIEWMNKVQQSIYYKTHYLINDDRYIVVVVAVSQPFHNDYTKFLKGQYSKMSERAKQLITSMYKNVPTKNFVLQTINKDDMLRQKWNIEFGLAISKESEYWYKPVMEFKRTNPFSTGEVLTKEIKTLL